MKRLNWDLLAIMTVGLMLFSCGGGSKANNSDYLSDIKKEIVERNVKIWENEITETPIENVVGFISRGRTNLKVTGIVTDEDLNDIGNAIESVFRSNATLFRLDFSEAILDVHTLMGIHGAVSSLTVPRGVRNIDISSRSPSFLIDFNIPKTDSGIERLILRGAFARVIIPADITNMTVQSLNNFAAILYEGREHIILERDVLTGRTFSYNSIRWPWRRQNSMYTLVLPSTLTGFSGTDNGSCEVIYSFAVIPPRATDGGRNQFRNVKTIYVPAGSLQEYTNAWFNYTGAEFKPLPNNMQTIDQFIQNWRPAENNLGISVERNDN